MCALTHLHRMFVRSFDCKYCFDCVSNSCIDIFIRCLHLRLFGRRAQHSVSVC